MKPISGQAISFAQLRKEGNSGKAIRDMLARLLIFPSPFKGIYYIPMQDERGGWLIKRPEIALRQAIAIYLGSGNFYYSCKTAEEFHGIDWHSYGQVHVVNPVRSGRINLKERIERNRRKKTWRAKQVARILEFYGNEIVFHRADAASISKAKIKRTPYGDYALPSQIKRDRKRFREKK
ncbi:MAG: hypothetical protein NTX79_01110 [Candidatus Micrarchaeota archaeon]|nr:hypothetical protein [Candidatus Micrarchaeota archaeon]